MLSWYTILQTSNEINASLQKLSRGNNIFTLNFTLTTKKKQKKTKSKKGHNLTKILQTITNIELDLYFIMIYPSANFQYMRAMMACNAHLSIIALLRTWPRTDQGKHSDQNSKWLYQQVRQCSMSNGLWNRGLGHIRMTALKRAC